MGKIAKEVNIVVQNKYRKISHLLNIIKKQNEEFVTWQK